MLSYGDRARVIVAGVDHLFQPRDINIGPEQEGRVRVINGLKVGETIVAEGALFLQQEIESQSQ